MRNRWVGPMVLIAGATLVVACGLRNVSYAKEVQPILTKNCSECHSPGQQGFTASGLNTTSYAALMKGGRYGPLVKPGDAFTSALNMLVEGRVDKSIRMPHGRDKLSNEDIAVLKAWVNEGAKNN
jgi:mono/diheme cytochrome c family protein